MESDDSGTVDLILSELTADDLQAAEEAFDFFPPIVDEDLFSSVSNEGWITEDSRGSPRSDGSVDGSGGGNVCSVCHAPTGSHFHYGAISCLSCRGFFRRAIKKDNYKEFKCPRSSGPNPCPIDSRSRRSCRACRYTLCLRAGMKAGFVQGSRIDKKMAAFSASQAIRQIELGYAFTQDDRKQFLDLFRQMMSVNYGAFADHIGLKTELFSSVLSQIFSPASEGLSARAGDAIEHVDEVAWKTFFFSLPQLSKLSLYDKMTLVTGTYPAVYLISCALCADRRQLAAYFWALAMFLKKQSGAEKLNGARRRALDTLDQFVERDFASDPNESNFYANSAMTKLGPEMEGDFRREILDHSLVFRSAENQEWTRKRFTLMDPVLTILCLLVVATDVGVLPLQQREVVQEVQEKHAWLLMRYLKTSYPKEANGKFHRLIMPNPKFSCMYNSKNVTTV